MFDKIISYLNLQSLMGGSGAFVFLLVVVVFVYAFLRKKNIIDKIKLGKFEIDFDNQDNTFIKSLSYAIQESQIAGYQICVIERIELIKLSMSMVESKLVPFKDLLSKKYYSKILSNNNKFDGDMSISHSHIGKSFRKFLEGYINGLKNKIKLSFQEFSVEDTNIISDSESFVNVVFKEFVSMWSTYVQNFTCITCYNIGITSTEMEKFLLNDGGDAETLSNFRIIINDIYNTFFVLKFKSEEKVKNIKEKKFFKD